MSPDRAKRRSGRPRSAERHESAAAIKSRLAAEEAKQAAEARTTEAWTVRPASASAHKQWQAAVAAAPGVMAKVRGRLRTKPMYRGDNPRRTARLRAGLAKRVVGDTALPQWQHEISGAGRIWYCPDPQTHTVWVTHVTLSHPKATE